MVKLNLDVMDQIVDRFQKGDNHSNISRAEYWSHNYQKVCLKFQETGSVIGKKRSGRPKRERDDYFVEL